MRLLAPTSSMLIAIIFLLSMAKAQGLNPPPALKDRGINGTMTNYFLSFVPNLDMSLLNRAQVLSIKQYHMRHGIHSAKSSSKGNAIYISLLLCISNDVHPHPGPSGVPKYPCGVCRPLGRLSLVMHVMCGITRTAWV